MVSMATESEGHTIWAPGMSSLVCVGEGRGVVVGGGKEGIHVGICQDKCYRPYVK